MGSGSNSKRKKKRSQKRSKKRMKSTKDKTKKRKRGHDSVSCSDEDSVSSLSMSLSNSSEDDHRSKKRARSLDRKEGKKRAKKSSLVSESSGDDTPRLKKRKRSKKSKDSESRKKRHKKKHRRDSSVSVSSGRSRSVSPHERGNSSEREFEKRETKKRKGKNKGNDRSGLKKSRHRSRSCSCSSHSVSHSDGSVERVMQDNNPRRLKSIIVAVHNVEDIETRQSNWEGNKDEIVYEHDDYPSKSNDSIEGVSKKEALSYIHDVSSDKPRHVDGLGSLAIPTNAQTSEFPESERLTAKEIEGTTSSNINSGSDQLKGNRSDFSSVHAGSNTDDLEVLLRQKALENLLKRQGKLTKTNAAEKKGSLGNEVKVPSSLETDQVQHIFGEQRGVTVQKLGTMHDANIMGSPSSTKVSDVHLPNCELGTGIRTANKAPGDFVYSGSKPGLATPRIQFNGGRNTWRRPLVSQESSRPNLSVVKETADVFNKQTLVLPASSQENLSVPEEPKDDSSKRQLIQQASTQLNMSAPEEAMKIDSSKGFGSACLESKLSSEKLVSTAASETSAAGGQSSIEKTSKPDEDSQFQQKTMSVMRGGEMVEVSYKVYIPKKAPALARRQLRR